MAGASSIHAVSSISPSRPRWAIMWEQWQAHATAANARRSAEAELRGADTQVKAHEATHLAVAGPYARGGAEYSYVLGPNGERYAVGGSVRVDLEPVPGDPEATLRKAQAIMRAAVSPGAPSAADMRIAAEAYRMAAQAQREIEEKRDSTPGQLVNLQA